MEPINLINMSLSFLSFVLKHLYKTIDLIFSILKSQCEQIKFQNESFTPTPNNKMKETDPSENT